MTVNDGSLDSLKKALVLVSALIDQRKTVVVPGMGIFRPNGRFLYNRTIGKAFMSERATQLLGDDAVDARTVIPADLLGRAVLQMHHLTKQLTTGVEESITVDSFRLWSEPFAKSADDTTIAPAVSSFDRRIVGEFVQH